MLDRGEIGLKKDILTEIKQMMSNSKVSSPYQISMPDLYQKYTFFKNRQEVRLLFKRF